MNTLLFDLDRADIAASTADQRETGAVNILNIAAVPTNQRGMFFFYIVIFKKLFYLQPYFWSKLCLPVVVLWIYICADLLVHLKVGWIFKLAQVSPWDLVNRIKSVSNYLQINKI